MSFGPVSSAANSSDSSVMGSMLGLLFIAISVSFVLIQLFLYLKRNRDIRMMVVRHSWQWLGEALPYSLPERELLSLNSTRDDIEISNAFAGTIRDIEFVCCDCTLGGNKHKKSVTLIAARSDENPFSVSRWDSSYHSTNADGWIALLPDKKHTLPVSIIEALIENISAS